MKRNQLLQMVDACVVMVIDVIDGNELVGTANMFE